MHRIFAVADGKQTLNVKAMSRDLARIIVRQYPPRRDALWNPDLFKHRFEMRSENGGGAPGAASVTAGVDQAPSLAAGEALSLPLRLWANEDVRDFTMTFTVAFVGLMVFLA